MQTLRTVTVTNGRETRTLEVVHVLGKVKLWDRANDEYCDSLVELPDDSDESVADAIRGNGFEIA